MASSNETRSGEAVGDISIIVVTAAQLIFFRRYYEYIAWYTRGADGSVVRIPVLTDGYFSWLPIVTAGSIIVIIASIAMIIFRNETFRTLAQVLFNIIGITIGMSLLIIWPFDFSVIPNETAADLVPKLVTAFFVLLAVFYAVTALIMLLRMGRSTAKQDASG